MPGTLKSSIETKPALSPQTSDAKGGPSPERETVTAVIATYNYGRFLAESLSSVLNQTYPVLEVIVVDDGSTDDTGEVVKPFLKDPRVYYILNQHEGHAKSKNLGVKLARGKFVAFLDADDVWDLNKLERQMALFKNPYVGMVYSRLQYMEQDGRRFDVSQDQFLQPHRGWITQELFRDNFVTFSSSVVRRECFEKVGLLDETIPMSNDWDLWLRISLHYEIDFVDAPLVYYRVGHSNQLSIKLEVRHRCIDQIMKRFEEKYPFAVPAKVRRKAWAYTYANRGYYYRYRSLKTSFWYFFQSLKEDLLEWRSFRGLVKNMLICFKAPLEFAHHLHPPIKRDYR